MGISSQSKYKEVLEVNGGQFEVVQVSSLGGVCWVVNRIDELDTPRYFTSRQELDRFNDRGG